MSDTISTPQEEINPRETITSGARGITGSTGPRGKTGATGPTGATGTTATLQNALFMINPDTIQNGGNIAFTAAFINGNDITQTTASSIQLAAGHVYSISYTLSAAVVSFLEVTPHVNGNGVQGFGARADAGTPKTHANVSGMFLVDAMVSAVTIVFEYQGETDADEPFGNISIFEIL